MERLLSILLTASAMVMAGTLVRREYLAQDQPAYGVVGDPSYVSEWQAAVAVGIEVGEPTAAIKVVEFADLECPFCAQFQPRIDRLVQRFPGKVSQVFVHYPIASHKFAMPAARAAECAAVQGRFPQYVQAVYSKQDSLGLKAWTSYAADAAVPSIPQFTACVDVSGTNARIDDGVAMGEKLGVGGTPSIMINGWLFPHVPADSVLERTVEALLDGRKPVKQPWWKGK